MRKWSREFTIKMVIIFVSVFISLNLYSPDRLDGMTHLGSLLFCGVISGAIVLILGRLMGVGRFASRKNSNIEDEA